MNVNQFLKKYYRRLLAEGIIKATLCGACIAFAANAVSAFIYWMFCVGNLLLGAVLSAALGAAVGFALYFAKYRPNEKNVARRIDRYGFEERTITMLELDGDDSCIAELQRADAQERIGRFSPKSIKFGISRLFVAIFAVAITVSISFSVIGMLAKGGKLPYGKDWISGGADGSFDVEYTVEGGGYIRGEQKQSVKFGGSTEAVRAVAENGWIFVGWDDENKNPERSEDDVRASLTVKAIFRKIDSEIPDDDDSDSADDLPYGSVIEEAGGGNGDELGGDNIKDDGEGSGGGKWQDRNQFIDGATYYRDYLEFYYQYAMGLFEGATDIPPEIIEFFETYFSGI